MGWLYRHRKVLVAKVGVGAAMTFANFYPDWVPPLLVNWVWLLLF